MMTALLASVSLFAGTTKTLSLSGEGWTCDGAPVSVPHCWNSIDGADGPNGESDIFRERRTSAEMRFSYWRGEKRYVRALPDPTEGTRQFVRFEAASQKARVFVNDREIGTHRGAFTAFCYEITEAMKPSGNEMVVLVDNSYDLTIPPVSADFTVYGGIYRDVWFIETPMKCIDRTIDGGPGVELDVRMDGHVTAFVRVLGGTNETRELFFKNPVRWSPENPTLYTATVTLDSGDSVSLDFGFRTCEFREDGFYLNGEKVFLRGVNRHQDREGKGWAVSKQDELEDVTLIKEMGANAVRTAHYPTSENFYSLCDRAGFVTWCENPLVNSVTFSDDFDRNLRTMYREMVAQLKHHPSICMWSVMNEIYGNYRHPKGVQEERIEPYAKWAKTLDPTRPQVGAADDSKRTRLNRIPADALAFNKYPGWYDNGTVEQAKNVIDEMFALNPTRKILGMSEYGAGGSVRQHGDSAEDCRHWTVNTEEYQARAIAHMYDAITGDGRFWGCFTWVMFDFGSDMRKESDRAGINNKGIVTFDRKTKKDVYWFYKANWTKEPVLHLVGTRRTECGGKSDVLVFSNVGEVTLKVNGKVVGSRKSDRVNRVNFAAVPMAKGENLIEVSAGGRTAAAVWKRAE